MSKPFLSFYQLQQLCQELQSLLIGSQVVACRTIGEQTFFLLLNLDQKKTRLLFSFKKPLLCFHLMTSSGKSEEHPLDSWLKEYQLNSIELLNQDRILSLGFHSKENQLWLISEFFDKHPNCYLINEKQKILYSLYPSPHSHYQLPPSPKTKPFPSTPLLTHKEAEALYARQKLEEEKLKLRKKLDSKIKKLHQQEQQAQREKEVASNWALIAHEGELLKAHFSLLKRGLSSLTVWDWEKDKNQEIALDPKRLPQEEISYRFKKSQKLKRAIPHLQIYREKIKTSLQALHQVEEELEKIESIEQLDLFRKKHFGTIPIPSHLQKKKKSLPYQVYLSKTGKEIWVGKSAKHNETLTFKIAHGSDWWLHTKEVPGSHVIIPTPKGKEPDPETLQDALQLALQNSKAKQEKSAEIIVTLRKFVSPLGKEKAGKVQISKHKVLHVKQDQQRYKLIQARSQH